MAVKIPSTEKPGINHETSKTTIPFTIKANNPSVITDNGNDIKCSIGLIVTLAIPNAIAVKINA